MKKILSIFIAIASLACVVVAGSTEKHTYKPEDGYVPDEETAIAIAVAVWNPIYGQEKIEKEKPYKATLSNGVWIVSGSLLQSQVKSGARPKIKLGGVAIAEISKSDGAILRVSHGK